MTPDLSHTARTRSVSDPVTFSQNYRVNKKLNVMKLIGEHEGASYEFLESQDGRFLRVFKKSRVHSNWKLTEAGEIFVYNDLKDSKNFLRINKKTSVAAFFRCCEITFQFSLKIQNIHSL